MAVIANADELEQFRREDESSRKVTPAIRGVLVETASTGIVRYSWQLLKPIISDLIVQNVREYQQLEQSLQCGPPRPLQTAESPEALIDMLKEAMLQFEKDPPFTIQRLCEVVLEPRKQYRILDKMALSLEKLLLVTTTVPVCTSPPAPPLLADLPAVNECVAVVQNRDRAGDSVSAVANGDTKAGSGTGKELGLAGAALSATQSQDVADLRGSVPDAT